MLVVSCEIHREGQRAYFSISHEAEPHESINSIDGTGMVPQWTVGQRRSTSSEQASEGRKFHWGALVATGKGSGGHLLLSSLS